MDIFLVNMWVFTELLRSINAQHSRQSHTLHLDLHPLRQIPNSHTAPRRLRIRKMQFILAIHFGKIAHIRQEDSHLHHLAQITTSFLEDLVDVLDA